MMRRWLWLIAAFLVGAVALLPLRAVLALGNGGLAARGVSGSLWSGTADRGRLARRAAGRSRCRAFTLVVADRHPGAGLRRPGTGRHRHASRGQRAVGQRRCQRADAAADRPHRLADVDIVFATSGSAPAPAAWSPSLPPAPSRPRSAAALQGTARCDAGALLLPLASATAQMQLRIAGNGAWRAEISVTSVEKRRESGLLAAGFAPTPQGLSRVLEGHCENAIFKDLGAFCGFAGCRRPGGVARCRRSGAFAGCHRPGGFAARARRTAAANLAKGSCALFLWDRSSQQRVVMATAAPAAIKVMRGGKPVVLARQKASGTPCSALPRTRYMATPQCGSPSILPSMPSEGGGGIVRDGDCHGHRGGWQRRCRPGGGHHRLQRLKR